MAGFSRRSADGAGDDESVLADVFRDGNREDRGRFRFSGSSAVASGVIGLAGDGVRAHGLEREGDAAPDRDQLHIPAVFGGDFGSGGRRPRESIAGPRAALSTAGGADSGSGAGHRRATGGESGRTV